MTVEKSRIRNPMSLVQNRARVKSADLPGCSKASEGLRVSQVDAEGTVGGGH